MSLKNLFVLINCLFMLILQKGEAIGVALVTNSGVAPPATVSIIDTNTKTVIATVTVGDGPLGVAITPDGKEAYVANSNDDNVSIIDTITKWEEVIATVLVGVRPNGVAITPDGKEAYVTNNGSDNVSIIDTNTKAVIATVIVGDEPVGVAITPDGKEAYVANSLSVPGTVSIIDTNTKTVIATVPVGTNPLGVAITPDGKEAYVANSGAVPGTVSIIDTNTKTVVATVPVGTTPFAVAICFAQLEVMGETKRDIFLTQTELFNLITWTTPQGQPTSFEIYLGEPPNNLIGTAPGDANEFIDHNQKKNETKTYVVIAKNGNAVLAKGNVTITTQ